MTPDSTPPGAREGISELFRELGPTGRLSDNRDVADTSLAPETPLPRCLTDGALLAAPGSPRASQIPPAPRLPDFESGMTDAAPGLQADEEDSPTSETCLGLPTDRVLPGSPALVSTFRPKPTVRSCYSITHSCQEERVFPRKRATKRPASKKRR
jgi:hypothetical protein